jgi:hypothetical protein
MCQATKSLKPVSSSKSLTAGPAVAILVAPEWPPRVDKQNHRLATREAIHETSLRIRSAVTVRAMLNTLLSRLVTNSAAAVPVDTSSAPSGRRKAISLCPDTRFRV